MIQWTLAWRWRQLVRALALLLWFVVILLAVEVFERLRVVMGERDALAQIAAMHVPPVGMRQATTEERQAMLEHGVLPSRVLQSARAMPVTPPSPVSGHDAISRFEQLLTMDEDARQARATLDGELWFAYRSDGSIFTSFGDPFPLLLHWPSGPPTQLKEFRHGTMRAGDTERLIVEGNPVWDYEISRHLRPASGEEGELSVFRFHLLTLDISLEELARRQASGPDSDLLAPQYALKPNQRRPDLTTDQFGYMNAPVTLPKPDGVYRVLAIGGSTMADGAFDSGRTTDWLQKMLQEDFPGQRVEVLNAALPGATSFEMRLRARDFARYEPDIVIYYEGINDLMQYLNLRRLAMPGSRKWLLQSLALRRVFGPGWLASDAGFETHWRLMTQRNLLAVKLALDEAGIPFAAMSFVYPRKHLLNWREWNYIDFNARTSWGAGVAGYDTVTRYLDLHNAFLRQLSEDHAIAFIPLAEGFDHGMSHFKDLCHLTPEGMRDRAGVMRAWFSVWRASH